MDGSIGGLDIGPFSSVIMLFCYLFAVPIGLYTLKNIWTKSLWISEL